MIAGRLQQLWRGLPIGSLETVSGPNSCLILAPHPDDESLGCGGLIAACCAASRPPMVAILTDGGASHPASRQFPQTRLVAQRALEVTQATGILGLPKERLIFLGEPDTLAPHCGPRFDAIVRRLVGVAGEYHCSTLLAPWRHDPHCDHAAAARIAHAVARIGKLRLLEYPVWGWTLPTDVSVKVDRVQGWRFDVAHYLPTKRRAIAAHASQYGQLITDDQYGFRLPHDLLRVFDENWETFLLP